jgi:precorrin-3B C17-methyltransferase
MLYVIGIGPGHPLDRTRRAEESIARSTVIVGYRPYLKCVRDLTEGKEILALGMRQEVDRCRLALERAAGGAVVALLSSGDAGVYGMAGLAIEVAARQSIQVPIEIISGISAANSAASRLGAPLMLDYACISLSDLLVPWDLICRRLKAVAAADLVVALYNVKSRKRSRQIEEVAEIFRQHRAGTTPVGIATAVGREEERLVLSDLDHFLKQEMNMQTLVIIGNSTSQCINGRFITPRGYSL